MKRGLGIGMIMAVLCLLFAQAKAQRVMRHNVPDAVQESFELAHPVSFYRLFTRWDWTNVGYCAGYNSFFQKATSLFQENGEWVSTRWKVSESNLPLKAHDFISSKYAFYKLRSCAYEEDRWQGRHYYALFSIRGIDGYMTEVCFDLQGNVVSIDGNEDEDWDDFEPLNEEEVLLLQASQVMGKPERKPAAESDSVAVEPEFLSIGFFAWKEDYRAMRELKERKKYGDRSVAQDSMREPTREDLAKDEADFEKEKQKQTERLYKDQSRRDFAYAQVVAQSMSAEKKQMKEDFEAEADAAPSEEAVEQPQFEVAVAQEQVAEPEAAPSEEAVEQPQLEVVAAQEQVAEPEAAPSEVEPQQLEVVAEPEPEPEAAPEPEPEAAPEPEPAPAPLVRTTGMKSAMTSQTIAPVAVSIKTIFPEPIQQAFNKRFPKAENQKYYRDTNTNYRAVFNNFGQKAEAVFLHDGTHITTALFFNDKEMSYPIRYYLESQPHKYRFVSGKRIVYESRYRQRFSAAEKPQNYFEIVVWKKDKGEKERQYFMMTFDHKGHFVSSIPYDYVGSR